MIDRSQAARLLAQAIAYDQCGKADEAHAAAQRLVGLLVDADILRAGEVLA